ncbi:MAG TPA: tetratricopeptide repeat protein [Nitrospirota bacterium]
MFIPLAEEYLKAGMLEEAVFTLEEGLKANPFYMSARVMLGRALLEKGDTDGACKQFEAVVKTAPDNLLAHRKLGEIYRLQGRVTEAIRSFRMLTLLNPKDAEAKEAIEELESGKPPDQPETGMVLESHREEAPAAPVRQDLNQPTAQVFDLAEADEDETSAASVPVYEIDEPDAPGAETGACADYGQATPAYELPELDISPELDSPEPASSQPGSVEEPASQTGPDSGVEVEMPIPLMQTMDDFALPSQDKPFSFDDVPEFEMQDSEEPAPVKGFGVTLPSDIMSSLADEAAAMEPEEEQAEAGDSVYEIQDDFSSVKPDVPVFEAEPVPSVPIPSLIDASYEEQQPVREVFETQTLADLYEQQGFFDRALNIYKNLLMEQPHNQAIKLKINELYKILGMPPEGEEERPVQSPPQASVQTMDEAEPEIGIQDFGTMEEPSISMHHPPEPPDAGFFISEPIEGIDWNQTPDADQTPATQLKDTGLTGIFMKADPASGPEPGPEVHTEARPFAAGSGKAVERLERFLDNIRRKAGR